MGLNLNKKIKDKIIFYILKTIVTFFGSGLPKIAPGTCGSLATYILIVIICNLVIKHNFLAVPTILLTITITFIIGIISTYYYMKMIKNNHDPQEVVIDEVVGQLLSFTLSFSFLLFFDNDRYSVLLNNHKLTIMFFIIMPFILFRYFDITKPSLVGYFDKIENAFGVMMDDVVAGIFAGITNSFIILLTIKLFVK